MISTVTNLPSEFIIHVQLKWVVGSRSWLPVGLKYQSNTMILNHLFPKLAETGSDPQIVHLLTSKC